MTTAPYPSYPSLEQFYDGRGGGHSGESDFGGFNWDDAIKPDPRESRAQRGRLRVALVHDTGDLYAVDNRGQGPVLLLGTFHQQRSREQVEQRLADWAEGDGPGRPLSWFRERIASLNAQGPERSGEADAGEAGPAFCHCAPEQVGGGQCFNTGCARGKEKLVSDLRNGPGHSVDSLIRPAFAAVDAYRADQRPPGEPDDYAKGYLDGQAYLAARLVHWAPEDHLGNLERPCRCLAYRVIEELRRDG